ncbi:DUF2505 family protein [Leptospira sp. GIMC2001]|uniref:DUF2505 family protein n=1 Tax=Leptospira sp. GIMC2001 TaxID=1513297 RepID=UPI00234BDA34|nr:DUF2505 family protein [Leptospira sp. GIMC2001]WCL47651.1 DUF2505 family protein [Leptospira sp. GIMC2001]
MKYKVTQNFEVPLNQLLQAREDRYKHLDKFPDLKNVTLIEEKRDGNKIFQKRKIDLGASLPPILATALSEPCLMEDSIFYTDTNTHEFKLYPPEKENVVTITGTSVYKATDDSKSERSYDVEVKSKVLFIAPAIELAIEGIHKHSLEKDMASIRKFLEL